MRNKQKSLSQLIGRQAAQDASQVTLKNQALATSFTTTSFISSYTGLTGKGFVGVPLTTQISDPNSCVRVSNGLHNADVRQNMIGYAQHATVCQNIERRTTILPCATILSTVKNAPSTLKCPKDPGQIFRNPTELIADQGRQADLRTRFNLPSKLQGLRGPVYNAF